MKISGVGTRSSGCFR